MRIKTYKNLRPEESLASPRDLFRDFDGTVRDDQKDNESLFELVAARAMSLYTGRLGRILADAFIVHCGSQ
jgi:hypothetical protein